MLDKEIESENTAGLKRSLVADSRVTVGIESAKRRILYEIKRPHGLPGNIYSHALENWEDSSVLRGDLPSNIRVRLTTSPDMIRIGQGPGRTRIDQPPIWVGLTLQ